MSCFLFLFPTIFLFGQDRTSDIEAPVFSHTSGFYEASFSLSLTHTKANAVIIYTLDGSEPDISHLDGKSYHYKNRYPESPGQSFGELLSGSIQSHPYATPITIENKSGQPNGISMISSTWEFAPNYLPQHLIPKATVVRAAAYMGEERSSTVTHVFFVGEANSFSSKLPIINLSVNEDDLMGYEDGIYVAGIDFDMWRQSNPGAATHHFTTAANFQRRGSTAERKAHLSYFYERTEVLNMDLGIRVHGAGSRYISNKSFRLYPRSDYDSLNRLEYDFFGKDQMSYNRLMLRFDGRLSDARTNFIRDPLLQKIVANLQFDTQEHREAIVYINGEYWGLYGIRTRYDKHYFERVYGIEEGELDYLFNNMEVIEGDSEHYTYFYNFVRDNDLAKAENYEYLKTLMDIENFTDYFISQIYMGNYDWPGNNINYFRKKTTEYLPQAQYGHDGRWRWFMADLDHGFGHTRPVSFNNLQYTSTAGSSTWANYDWATLVFRKLLKNEAFKTQFIIRFADLLNTNFLPHRVNNLIDAFAGEIESDVKNHIQRWNRLSDVNQWQDNVELLREFANARPKHQRNHIKEQFDISGLISCKLNVDAPFMGYIKVNTIDIQSNTPGLPEQAYPWEGVYFENIPLSIQAIPYPGFEFVKWTGSLNHSQNDIIVPGDENIILQAHFRKKATQSEQLLHFWVSDKNTPNNYPFQKISSAYSYGSTSGKMFFSSSKQGYPFYYQHAQWRKASLERRNTPSPLNYYPIENTLPEYDASMLRAFQIKQPFKDLDKENILQFSIPTIGYKEIMFRFAAKDEGAAQFVFLEYWDNYTQQWVSDSLDTYVFKLHKQYQVLECDLSKLQQATNNEELKIRLRFDGPDMSEDQGNRISITNISVLGKAMSAEEANRVKIKDKVLIYPNPARNNVNIRTQEGNYIKNIEIYSITGEYLFAVSPEFKLTYHSIDIANLSSGIYLINVLSEKHSSMEKVIVL